VFQFQFKLLAFPSLLNFALIEGAQCCRLILRLVPEPFLPLSVKRLRSSPW
jgi:hypothetical protein